MDAKSPLRGSLLRANLHSRPMRNSLPSASCIDDAMLAIESSNASLKGVLPKDYTHLTFRMPRRRRSCSKRRRSPQNGRRCNPP